MAEDCDKYSGLVEMGTVHPGEVLRVRSPLLGCYSPVRRSQGDLAQEILWGSTEGRGGWILVREGGLRRESRWGVRWESGEENRRWVE